MTDRLTVNSLNRDEPAERPEVDGPIAERSCRGTGHRYFDSGGYDKKASVLLSGLNHDEPGTCVWSGTFADAAVGNTEL